MSLKPTELDRFAERYLLAKAQARKDLPDRGTSGMEVEWNLLDSRFRPLQIVGAGPEARSFADLLQEVYLPEWLDDRHQLEVFHWMIEFATRPYYSPKATIYETRLLEANLLNAMAAAGADYFQRLFTWHGNLLFPVEVADESIPRGWNLAKRRYLERCVELYGAALSTAGSHSNVSLPEPLLSWDFMHLPDEERHEHLDGYKNRVYIHGTKILRAFASLFIAAGASTPFKAEWENGKPVIRITEVDSLRNLTFPNPETIDVPLLYRSHADYIERSYELVQEGIRFGNNNWTPVRARSFAEPVERVIGSTSSELQAVYENGLYAEDAKSSLEELAQQIELQNLRARIDIPMARVEVRTDDGGLPMDLEIANLALKELLLIQAYADETFGNDFEYSRQDIARVRSNEQKAASEGMKAQIAHPFTGQRQSMPELLTWTLDQISPIAGRIGYTDLLEPLRELASGGANQSSKLRAKVREQVTQTDIVPWELFETLVEEHEIQVSKDVSDIAEDIRNHRLPEESKLVELLWKSRSEARKSEEAPIRFRPRTGAQIEIESPDKVSEILHLAQSLIRIPSVTNAPFERQRHDDLDRAATLIHDYLLDAGCEVTYYDQGQYPAVLATFPEQDSSRVMLSGHFDVVEPEPDDSQFEPYIEGEYLVGRGAADMKTVVATMMVWLKDQLAMGVNPPISLLLIGNEEIGEGEPFGTPHVLADLRNRSLLEPELLIAGERTGEHGDERVGQICIQNRGLLRMEFQLKGSRGHTGLRGAHSDLSQQLVKVQSDLTEIMASFLTLEGEDGWQSQARFPYIRTGEPGIFNVSSEQALLGLEVRPIPDDNLDELVAAITDYCAAHQIQRNIVAAEPGVACDEDNPYLLDLIASVEQATGKKPEIGRKLPGTSARFAPKAQGIVWGQSGVGPHSADERHFIPSIKPYYDALNAYADRLLKPAP
ncbi:MAG: M20/M25/M40 family metallo-hydrolase [Anaerolineales bacterium]|jgi:acetylornithine deacetylase/succinyl-diaminopimelate desuccinylase-like protein